MPDLLILVLVLFTNGQLARKKGHNSWLWMFISLIAFFTFQAIFGVILILMMYHGPVNAVDLRLFMEGLPQSHPLTMWTIMLFGVGGGLLIRFIIERLPVNNNTP